MMLKTARWTDVHVERATARVPFQSFREILKKSSPRASGDRRSPSYFIYGSALLVLIYVLQGAESDGRAKLFGSLKLKPTYTAAASICTTCLVGSSIGSGRYTWHGWMDGSINVDGSL
jgi:hypothetical protein